MKKLYDKANKVLVNYLDNSGVHGLKYVAARRLHFLERLFWASAWSVALVGTVALMRASLSKYKRHGVSFGLDTAYIDWNTDFPAVSVCENESPDKIYSAGNRIFGEARDMDLDFFLRDIAFYDGVCYSCKSHCGRKLNCSQNLNYLVEKTRSSCNELFSSCSWNGVPFKCCDQFRPLSTETGGCFTINSLHSKFRKNTQLNLISNRKIGVGKLQFHVNEDIRFYLHSKEDVPYVNHPQAEKVSLTWGTNFKLLFHVNEIANDVLLQNIDIQTRRCRFPKENYLSFYNYYSYSACIVECRAFKMIQLCNCTHHFVPRKRNWKMCDYNGLACLTNHSEVLRTLRSGSGKIGLDCDCMATCTEPEFNIVSADTILWNEDDLVGVNVTIEMNSLPTQRFKRKIVRSRLDLVVTMGSVAGLFLGASLLSAVEFLYFIFVRPFFKGTEKKQNFKEKRLNQSHLIIRTRRFIH